MYLFYRSARLGPGSAREQMAWALNMTEKVNQISEAKFSLWTPFMSPGVNTLVWTTFVDDLMALEATNDKLMADESYHMLLDQGTSFASTDAIDDGLQQIIHADEMDPEQVPAYVSAVDSVCLPGQLVRGIEVGIEIADHAKKTTGVSVAFASGVTGAYGAVAWHAAYESIEQLQKAGETLAADLGFGQLVDAKGKDVYQPGATTQTFYRRIL